jgi:hypothetical protein
MESVIGYVADNPLTKQLWDAADAKLLFNHAGMKLTILNLIKSRGLMRRPS